MSTQTALVFGAGGAVGLGWMTGVLFGLHCEGVNLTSADRLIGTSTGAILAAQIGLGHDLSRLFPLQAVSSVHRHWGVERTDMASLAHDTALRASRIESPHERRSQMQMLVAAAGEGGEEIHRTQVAEQIFGTQWPDRHLAVVAVDLKSGDMAVFDQHSGVDLIGALMASAATPGVWPVAKLNGRQYIDGTARCLDNADLAEEATRVVVLSPLGTTECVRPGRELSRQVAFLRGRGAEVEVLVPDYTSRIVFDDGVYRPQCIAQAAESGLAQGISLASRIAEFWS